MAISEKRIEKAVLLGKTMAHPLRLEILDTIGAQKRASTAELFRQRVGNASLGLISYHVGQLQKVGAIREVDSRPVRGAVEHFHALTPVGQAVLVLVADLSE